MPAQSSKSVVLTPHLEAFIDEMVASGRYQNASEVMREGLRLLERREVAERAELAWLRDQVAEGLAEAERGEFAEGSVEEIFRTINRELDEAEQADGSSAGRA